jgi:FHA domain
MTNNLTSYICPQGHQSLDPDYCSQCGSRISIMTDATIDATVDNSPGLVKVAQPLTTPAAISCPVCATTRTPGNFCETCGYNFLTGTPAELLASTTGWQIEVAIDNKLATPDSPLSPERPTQSIDLTVGSYLIGRTSQKRAILPQISLDFDDAVSHRHALIELRADRSLILRDIGSANGTNLNGHEIPLTRDIPLRAGDVVTLGHWTKITIINNQVS